MRGDIIGGLKLALSKGQNLQDAMQSFYNAGYHREEIIEAAKTLKTQGFVPQVVKEPALPETALKIKEKQTSSIPPPTQTVSVKQVEQAKLPPVTPAPVIQQQPQIQQPRQIISAYAQEEKKGVDVFTVLLVIILVLLVGVLVGVFFFKQEIIEFLNKILE